MTVRTVRSMFRPDSVLSRMYSDSGVVTRMCGGWRRMRARSLCGVSPVRTAALIGALAEHACRELAADALERRAQVLLDVVRQRFERRHVEDLRLVAQRARGGLLGEQIDDAQERGERLARARGRADQRVRAAADRVPGFELHARRRRESAAEPAGDGRVEGLGEHGLGLPKTWCLCPVH